MRGVRRDVMKFEKVGKGAKRLLSCGHTQVMVKYGGKTHLALTAFCAECLNVPAVPQMKWDDVAKPMTFPGVMVTGLDPID